MKYVYGSLSRHDNINIAKHMLFMIWYVYLFLFFSLQFFTWSIFQAQQFLWCQRKNKNSYNLWLKECVFSKYMVLMREKDNIWIRIDRSTLNLIKSILKWITIENHTIHSIKRLISNEIYIKHKYKNYLSNTLFIIILKELCIIHTTRHISMVCAIWYKKGNRINHHFSETLPNIVQK